MARQGRIFLRSCRNNHISASKITLVVDFLLPGEADSDIFRCHVSGESSAAAGFSLLAKARCQRGARNRWDLCLLMSSTVFSFFQKNNGAHASEGPCRAGFTQSFYSVLVSRDVLKGVGVRKGEWHRRRPGLRFPAALSPVLIHRRGLWSSVCVFVK